MARARDSCSNGMPISKEAGPVSPGGRHITHTLRMSSPGGVHEHQASYTYALTPAEESASDRKKRRDRNRGQEKRATTRLDFDSHRQYCDKERDRKRGKHSPAAPNGMPDHASGTPRLHIGISCSACAEPVGSLYYHCMCCPEYDLCPRCIDPRAAAAAFPRRRRGVHTGARPQGIPMECIDYPHFDPSTCKIMPYG